MSKSPQLRLPVTYGSSITLGVNTCGIGVGISRANCAIKEAEKFFTGRRLTVKMATADGDPDQKEFWSDLQDQVEAVADVKCYTARGESFGIRLTFHESDVKVDRLRKFLKRTGVLLVMGSERMVEVEPPTKDNGKAETPLLEAPKRERGRPRKQPA